MRLEDRRGLRKGEEPKMFTQMEDVEKGVICKVIIIISFLA